jgi:hypothetical protein
MLLEGRFLSAAPPPSYTYTATSLLVFKRSLFKSAMMPMGQHQPHSTGCEKEIALVYPFFLSLSFRVLFRGKCAFGKQYLYRQRCIERF